MLRELHSSPRDERFETFYAVKLTTSRTLEEPMQRQHFITPSNHQLHSLSQIILEILSYLDAANRKSCSLVCKRWLDLIFNSNLSKVLPLTIKNVFLSTDTYPAFTFTQCKTYREFRYVHISDIAVDDLASTTKMFENIGQATTHLTMINCYVAVNTILKCFPMVKVFETLSLASIELRTLPPLVQTVIVHEVVNWISPTTERLIRSFKNVSEIKCKSLKLGGSNKKMNQFLEVDEKLQKLIDSKAIGDTVNTDINLLSGKILTFEDITGLVLNTNFRDFTQLLEFTFLEVRYLDPASLESIWFLKSNFIISGA